MYLFKYIKIVIIVKNKCALEYVNILLLGWNGTWKK